MTALAIIGFGEAGTMFGTVAVASGVISRVYDRKTDDAATATAKLAEYDAAGAAGCASAADALADSKAVLSLVTADQALIAAEQAAPLLAPGALWLDCNSVAPDTKRAAARAVAAAGGRYVDVALMSPVLPGRARIPLLVSGPHAAAAEEAFRRIGFADVRAVGGEIGRASAIKMIRSVMVKGIEALTAECALAAAQAGVLDEVLASLDASPPPPGWRDRADYNLDRMMIHGLRRAAEMEEVVKTLDALATGSAMSRGTVARQRAIGGMRLAPPPDGLDAKLDALGRSL